MYIIQLSPKQIKNYHKRGKDQISGRVEKRSPTSPTGNHSRRLHKRRRSLTATHKKQLKNRKKESYID